MADEDDQHEEISINTDKLNEDIQSIVKQKLGNEKWSAKKVDGWSKDIIEFALKSLAEMKKPFKYVVTCIIMQRNGAGMSSAYSSYGDNMRDSLYSVPCETEHLHCITTVYWVKLD